MLFTLGNLSIAKGPYLCTYVGTIVARQQRDPAYTIAAACYNCTLVENFTMLLPVQHTCPVCKET
jgi:hypothetical protein